MRSITADYQERIVIAPEDVIPKTSWFKFVKCSLLVALGMLVTLAVISLIVAESFVSNKHKDSLAIGIVSLVGIILFLMGMVAIMKEHIPLVLTFAVSMIIYLLVFMYSRVITSPGLIILRTFILLLLAVEAFCFCIMIRDWRAIQISRLNQRLIKEAQLAQYAAANGMMYGPGQHQAYHMQQVSPTSPIMSPMYTGPQQQQPHQYQPHHNQQHLQQQHQPHYQQVHHSNQQLQTQKYRQQQQQQQQQQRRTPQLQRGRNQGYPDQMHHQQQHYQHNMNPYIQVDEDENPYSVIGEPSRVQQTNSAIYTQTRFYVPDRY